MVEQRWWRQRLERDLLHFQWHNYDGAVFAEACLKGLNGVPNVVECSFVQSNITELPLFASNVHLSMDETEFQKNMESAQALIYGLSGDNDGNQSQSQSLSITEPKDIKKQKTTTPVQSTTEVANTKEVPSVNKVPSVSDLENKGAAILMKEETTVKEFKNFPYLYLQAGDLTVGDVEDLLDRYKHLVLKYVSPDGNNLCCLYLSDRY